MSSRYVVGIDLGTTHSALAWVDTEAGDDAPVQTLAIPQLVARGVLEERSLLPSFLYFAPADEGALPLPWDPARTFAVGGYARARGTEAPQRVIASAKSWLCHRTVDRRAGILPVNAAEDIERISPVEASYRLLDHLVEAWNARFPEAPLASQEVVLTVPASFDAAARELTAEAAVCAGIEHLTLLEEPQAALYAWIAGTGGEFRKHLHPGDVLLVVDVGGGTTDFSAIAVLEKDGALDLARIAVGDHILLGGDNMDLALAYAVKQRFDQSQNPLDAWQTSALTHAVRSAKEQLLGFGGPSHATVVIPGRGAKLLGGAVKSELTKADLDQLLVDGFFPRVDRTARPVVRARAALTQLGLPYASDAAVTRHLAEFLRRQAPATDALVGFSQPEDARARTMLHPTAVLLNGGVMKGGALKDRLVDVLAGWMKEDGGEAPRILGGADLDLACARGAAVYGHTRRGKGVRIRGGTARSYYVGIESAMPAVPGIEPPVTALCVAPFGMEEGTRASVASQELALVVGEPVRFRFFGSSTRRDDAAGAEFDVASAGDSVSELPAIEATLPAEGRNPGDPVPVKLVSTVTEIGTLLLEALPVNGGDERWKIELNVRGDG